jgi:lambda family phage tail tape measure protein
MPGAFSIFAESIGKTPQELDKMLSKGEVTLNDFMKFAQELSRRYGQSANEIAASSQSAGDRMQVTFARLREAIGRELQPIGAQFQEIFADFFAENEQAIVAFASSLAGVMKVFADNAGLISGVLKTLLGFGAIAGTAAVFAQVAAGVATLSAAIVQLGGVAGIASVAMQTLLASMAAIPVIGWIGAAVAGLALLGKAVYDTNETFRNFVDNIGGVLANDFRYAVTGMANDAKASTDQIQAAFDGLNKYFESTSNFVRQLFGDTFSSVSQSGQISAGQLDNSFSTAFSNITSQGAAAFNGLSALITNWYNQLPDPIRNILGGNTASILAGAAGAAGSAARRASQGTPERQGPYVPDRIKNAMPIVPAAFSFPTGEIQGGGKAGGGKGAKGPESRAAELKLDLHLREQMLEAESMIAQARLDGDQRLVAMLTTLQAQTRLVTEAAKVELDKIPAQDKALRLRILEQDSLQESAKLGFALAELEKKATDELKKSMEQISKQVDEFKNRAAFEREYGELIMQGSLPATARQYLETKRVVEETLRAAEAALAKAEADGVSADEIERQRKELERIRGAGQEELGRIQGGDDPGSIISGAITRVKGELNELMNIGNQVVGAATAIGDAFGNSFKGVISGSMSAKEALAGFFQSLADYFLDMAAKIIAKWIQMTILNSVLKLFPGGGGGLGSLGDNIAKYAPLPNANGNAFAQNGIVPYAKGGVVNRPTMFKFANGGTMQNGIMGEAGPEAIMPLKRGPDGKLGVQATGGGGINVTVNVDAKGTQVEGDAGQGKQLARVVAGAVQAEIVKQQRPGGLLADRR